MMIDGKAKKTVKRNDGAQLYPSLWRVFYWLRVAERKAKPPTPEEDNSE